MVQYSWRYVSLKFECTKCFWSILTIHDDLDLDKAGSVFYVLQAFIWYMPLKILEKNIWTRHCSATVSTKKTVETTAGRLAWIVLRVSFGSAPQMYCRSARHPWFSCSIPCENNSIKSIQFYLGLKRPCFAFCAYLIRFPLAAFCGIICFSASLFHTHGSILPGFIFQVKSNIYHFPPLSCVWFISFQYFSSNFKKSPKIV